MADVPVSAAVRSSAVGRTLRILPAVAWMGIINYVSSIPGSRLASIAQPDWALHLSEYLVLGLLLMFALSAFSWSHRALPYLVAAVIGGLHAVADEWHQSYVPMRDASLADVGFDLLGIALALTAVHVARRMVF